MSLEKSAMRTWHEAQTEEEQLRVLNETGKGALLFQFKEPSDAVKQRALELDGMALQYIVRPTLTQQLTAVGQDPYAVAWCPPKNRGREGVTAIHKDVQIKAFDREPLTLLAWREKFDADLDHANRAGLGAFADTVIEEFSAVVGDKGIHINDQANMRQALKDYVQEGQEDVPLLSWYKTHYANHDFQAVEGMAQTHAERVQLARDLVRGKKLSKEEIDDASTGLEGVNFA
jgi:hypothetical protein